MSLPLGHSMKIPVFVESFLLFLNLLPFAFSFHPFFFSLFQPLSRCFLCFQSLYHGTCMQSSSTIPKPRSSRTSTSNIHIQLSVIAIVIAHPHSLSRRCILYSYELHVIEETGILMGSARSLVRFSFLFLSRHVIFHRVCTHHITLPVLSTIYIHSLVVFSLFLSLFHGFL
jgi:hypothetical protein